MSHIAKLVEQLENDRDRWKKEAVKRNEELLRLKNVESSKRMWEQRAKEYRARADKKQQEILRLRNTRQALRDEVAQLEEALANMSEARRQLRVAA